MTRSACVETQIYADATSNGKTAGLRATRNQADRKSISPPVIPSIEFSGGPQAHFVRQFERPARRAAFKEPTEYAAMSRDVNATRIAEIVRTVRPPLQAPHAAF